MRISICPCRSSAFTTVIPKIGLLVKAGATAPRATTEIREIPNFVSLFIFMIFPPQEIILPSRRMSYDKKGFHQDHKKEKHE